MKILGLLLPSLTWEQVFLQVVPNVRRVKERDVGENDLFYKWMTISPRLSFFFLTSAATSHTALTLPYIRYSNVQKNSNKDFCACNHYQAYLLKKKVGPIGYAFSIYPFPSVHVRVILKRTDFKQVFRE